MAITPANLVTPMSTIVRAVMGFVESDEQNGQVAECSIDKIHYRQKTEWGDDDAEAIMSQLEALSRPRQE